MYEDTTDDRPPRSFRTFFNRAIGEFLTERPGVFEIAARYCNMFGTNATYELNGYLQRTAAPFNQ